MRFYWLPMQPLRATAMTAIYVGVSQDELLHCDLRELAALQAAAAQRTFEAAINVDTIFEALSELKGLQMSETLTAVAAPAPDPMTRERVIELVEKWRGLLLLNGHHIDVCFGEEACNIDKCCAEMVYNGPYQSGHFLTIHPRFFTIGDDAERERKIVHELCHIVTGESRAVLRGVMVDEKFYTWREAKAADEFVTDRIANIVFAMYDNAPERKP